MKQIKHVDYDQLPRKMQKKIKKRADRLEKKHPGISDAEVMEKIARKMKVQFEYE